MRKHHLPTNKRNGNGCTFLPHYRQYLHVRKLFSTSKWKPILFKRYIDDIFIIWPDISSLPAFLDQLNRYHPDIKFTINSSITTFNYLDITIYKRSTTEHTTLGIKTFQKPHNLHVYQYLQSSKSNLQRYHNRRMQTICQNQY